MNERWCDPFATNGGFHGPRLLFVGSATSSHAHSWIDLLRGSGFDLRLFSPVVNEGPLPDDVLIPTYLLGDAPVPDRPWLHRRPVGEAPSNCLEDVIRVWCPDIVHTFGLFDAGLVSARVRCRFDDSFPTRWVLQLRGGSDLELNRFRPERVARIVEAAACADRILSDNRRNFAYLEAMGVDGWRFADIAPVPGTGGLDADRFLPWRRPPAQRRLIVWPKCYNTAFAQALPVIEALRRCWERLSPCRIAMLWMVQNDVEDWLRTLPEGLRTVCDIRGHIPRDEVLELLGDARVMLAPSLVDGVPNSLYEAMVNGALPIVSPLGTITDVVAEDRNVLFARNLYPDEIAAALVRAMSDDGLVERATAGNLELVARIAGRAAIRAKVIRFYRSLMGEAGG